MLLRSKENVNKGKEMLLKAVRTFEKQFSSGAIEGVVFNDLNDQDRGAGGDSSNESSLDEMEMMEVRQKSKAAGSATAASNSGQVNYNRLRDPAYPASHPVNAQEFDPRIKQR